MSTVLPDPDEVNRKLEAASAEIDYDPAMEAAVDAAIAGAPIDVAVRVLEETRRALDPGTYAGPDKASSVWVNKEQRKANAAVNGKNGHGSVSEDRLGILTYRASEIQPKAITWLWDQRLACGKFSVISGNPGLGKSQACASLAAVVSQGGKWPVTRDQAPRGSVIILSAEDDPEDTIIPRLEAAGGDLTRIHIVQAMRGIGANGDAIERQFNLAADIPKLVDFMRELGDVKLVTIDPISAYFGGKDSHKDTEVRALLAPLQKAAQEMGAAIIGVAHLTKAEGVDILLRTQGSIGIVAAARAVFGVGKDKDDPGKRYFMPLKNNLATDMNGFSYRIEEFCLPGTDPLIRTSRVMWESELVTKDANEIFTTPDKEERNAVTEAEDFLHDALANGWVKTSELQAAARKAGISWTTIKRAQNRMGIKPRKSGFSNGWGWALPDSDDS